MPRSSKTHCKRGHELTDRNVYTCPDGYRRCRLCINVRSRQWAKDNHYKPVVLPEKRRQYQLKCEYDCPVDEYDRLFKQQDGKCAICGTPCKQQEFLAIDHDHWAEEVFGWSIIRGLLCKKCNLAAGLIKDDHVTAGKLAAYLAQGGTNG